MNDYTKYIIKRGSEINKDVKNNIYYNIDNQTRLLLIEYILDTMNNYSYTYCPDYVPTVVSLVTEDTDYYISTEDAQFRIVTESASRDLFSKLGLDRWLKNLTKGISC